MKPEPPECHSNSTCYHFTVKSSLEKNGKCSISLSNLVCMGILFISLIFTQSERACILYQVRCSLKRDVNSTLLSNPVWKDIHFISLLNPIWKGMHSTCISLSIQSERAYILFHCQIQSEKGIHSILFHYQNKSFHCQI